MTVIVGELLSADGLASRQVLLTDRTSPIGVRARRDAWANPADQLRQHHPLPIPVTIDGHDGQRIGEIVGVHRTKGRGGIVALAVAELADDDALLAYPDPTYFSAVCDAAIRPGSAIGHDIQLRAAALTTTPARLGAEPVTLLPGTLRDRRRWSLNGPVAMAVDETITQHRHEGDVLYVTGWQDDEAAAYVGRAAAAQPDAARPPRRLWHSQPHSGIISVR